MRRAQEWSRGYKFWSCADVDIISKQLPVKELCTENGKYEKSSGKFKKSILDENVCIILQPHEKKSNIINRMPILISDKCLCNPKFYGNRCQYMNECSNDGDCLNGGR